MRPEVRHILAPIAALTGVSLLVVYAASCSGALPDGPSTGGATDVEDCEPGDEPLAAGTPAEVDRLKKFTDELPDLSVTPPPQVAAGGELGPTVLDVIDAGCSTAVVNGLSEQIIAEGNCIQPGAYARVPEMKNLSFGSAVFPYMLTAAVDALSAAAERGKRYDMKVNSMLRTVAQQYLLYSWYERNRCGIKLAALPGNSNHQSGLAIDISTPGTWKKFLQREGFRWMGEKDRWHFDYVGTGKQEVEARKGLDVMAFQRLWNRNHPDEPIRTDGGWGSDTERAIRRAPASGFGVGAVCRFGDGDDE